MKHLFSILTAIFAVFAFFISCGGSEGSSEPGSIYGVVTDKATGDPIINAGVELKSFGLKTVTGSDGQFEFQELDPGQYTVTVQTAGYTLNRKTVMTVAGELAHITIILSKKEAD